MRPGDELAREVIGDGVAADEAGEQALAEQLAEPLGDNTYKVDLVRGLVEEVLLASA